MKKFLLILVTLICSLQILAQTGGTGATDTAVVATSIVQEEATKTGNTANDLGGQAKNADHENAGEVKKGVADAGQEAKAEKEQAHPVTYGWIVGSVIILALLGALILLTIMLKNAIGKNEFNLKEALSENVVLKQIQPNEQYVQLAGIIKEVTANSTTPAATIIVNKAVEDQKKAEDATANRKRAESDLAGFDNKLAALDTDIKAAQQIVADQKTATTPDQAVITTSEATIAKKEGEKVTLTALKNNPEVLQKLKEEEAAALVTAAVSAKAAQAITLSPTMLVNLGNLFPPTIEVTQIGSAGNTQSGQPTFRASASRLIAFLSAMLLLIVGFGATCFFIYFYLVVGIAPDLSKLTAVLIALGIGMAPYVVNKVANASTDRVV